ncbi:MAG TPA: NADH-quinone oxidoreductase subunit J [Anaerolineae bacterium]|nr:NADH-quinone oxidoreductase subunit J [Caldilineae bacterium]HID35732.1 NADH-quinone oxidoreductase subunit J [Anaerolineae bacterium]
MVEQILFLFVAAVTLLMALGVALARNLFHAALFLVGVFFGIAVLFILLEAEFLGMAQIVIYIGAIATLIVFAIMLSKHVMGKEAGAYNGQLYWALGGVVFFFLLLGWLLIQMPFKVVEAAVPDDAIAQIGQGFVGHYVVPFEVASVLLLVALVGAIMLARERN